MLSRSLLSQVTKPRTLVTATSVLALSYFAASTATLGNSPSRAMSSKQYPVTKSDQEWQLQLSKEQFRILREKGTEMAGTGEYDKHYPSKGVYECAGCAQPLYTADTKFKSGCGWPAFFAAIPGAVEEHTDSSWGMQRTEIVCSNCGGHLGHLFKGEGFDNPTTERACVNSISIKFNEAGEGKYEGQRAKK
ncbi:hypothetical protein JCM10207_003542 [Rhodosporidiobolus poonsookiae]